MKILYVTGMCGPIIDIMSGKTEDEITGGPGFFHPWYRLVKRGHQVDFILASNFNAEPQVKVDWFSPDNVYANVYDPFIELPWYRRGVRRIKRFVKLLYYTNKAISENHYDFIYCKAFYEGLAGNIVANLRGVPCGVRSMGTVLYRDFQKFGVIGTAIRRPAEYVTFKMKKEFFLMTDDGTKGDLVYDAWRPKKKKYDYLFWKTGVDVKDIHNIDADFQKPAHDYLFLAARFDQWKRHDRVLRVLKRLHNQDITIHLYFAGPVESEIYLQSLKKLVLELGLQEYVHFLGPINQDQLRLYAYHAVANPLMYDMSNLGNVFFESFSVGAVIVSLADGSLDEYVQDGVNGFLIKDEEAAAHTITGLVDGTIDNRLIRENAVASAREKFLSLDARFEKEVDLIESTVNQRAQAR